MLRWHAFDMLKPSQYSANVDSSGWSANKFRLSGRTERSHFMLMRVGWAALESISGIQNEKILSVDL